MDVNQLIDAVGKIKGPFTNKSNRVAKLIAGWPTLEHKIVGMIERGQGHTSTAKLAYATLLMMETGIRTGNEKSAEGWICENQIICRKDNPAKGLKVGDVIWRHPLYGQHVQTFGLTTLRGNHANLKRKRLTISFVGKKLVDHELIVKHPTLIKFYKKRPSYALWLGIEYNDLKKFVKKYVGKNYTPKDIRMAKVNIIFIEIFGNDPRRTEFEDATTKSARKKILSEVIGQTADIIGHTKSVCRSAYLSADLIKRITQ